MILNELILKQQAFDEFIIQTFALSFEETNSKRLLALIVELGELANETKSFKYWSKNKSINHLRVVDEFVDVLHFSLSYAWKLALYDYDFKINLLEEGADISEAFLSVYQNCLAFVANPSKKFFITFFESFLSLHSLLEISINEIITGYQNKLTINYQRQENNY